MKITTYTMKLPFFRGNCILIGSFLMTYTYHMYVYATINLIRILASRKLTIDGIKPRHFYAEEVGSVHIRFMNYFTLFPKSENLNS